MHVIFNLIVPFFLSLNIITIIIIMLEEESQFLVLITIGKYYSCKMLFLLKLYHLKCKQSKRMIIYKYATILESLWIYLKWKNEWNYVITTFLNYKQYYLCIWSPLGNSQPKYRFCRSSSTVLNFSAAMWNNLIPLNISFVMH